MMGRLTTFRIVVNNGGMVKAGETLTGQVRLELRDSLQVNEVRISLTGLSSTQWAETQKSSSVPEMNTAMVDPVIAEEVYFSQPLVLWPPRQFSADSAATTTTTTTTSAPTPPPPPTPQPTSNIAPTETILTKGTHKIDFEFHVPDTCPPSFHGRNGFVLYQLKAVVERPARRRSLCETIVTTKHVRVFCELDLNEVDEAKESVYQTRDLMASPWLLPPVDCSAALRLSKKGFTQGETIPVDFSVHNNSAHAIQNVSLLLKMMILYKAGERRCESECVLDRCTLGKVQPHKTLEGLDKQLRVPATCPPSGLPGCNLIDIKYRLELKVKPSTLSLKRLKVHSDVIVGTRPLTPTSFQDSPPDYWSCCLPTYDEVMLSAPPPYSPPSSRSTAVSSPLPPSLAPPPLTPLQGSPRTISPGSLRGVRKDTTTQTVLRPNGYQASCVDWTSTVLAPLQGLSWM